MFVAVFVCVTVIDSVNVFVVASTFVINAQMVNSTHTVRSTRRPKSGDPTFRTPTRLSERGGRLRTAVHSVKTKSILFPKVSFVRPK